MTVRLLAPFDKYPANTIVTLDAGTEAGLVAAKQATATLTGGDAWVEPSLKIGMSRPSQTFGRIDMAGPRSIEFSASGVSYGNTAGGMFVSDGVNVPTIIGATESSSSLGYDNSQASLLNELMVWHDGVGLRYAWTQPAVNPPATSDTTAPSTPTGLAVSGTATTTVSLTWNAATDNVAVTGYQILRNGTAVGTTAGTSFTDTGLTANTAYTYTVRAYDAAGNYSAATAGVTGTTQASSDTTAPSTPTGLTQGSVSANSAAFSWTASTDNVAVTGYRVFRDGTQIGTPSGTSYTDTTVAASTTYSYTVRAVDAAGNLSAASSALSVTTPAAPSFQALRFTGGNALVETADTPSAGQYTYTFTGGTPPSTYGTTGMGVSSLSLPANTDGEIQCTVDATVIATGMPAFGVKSGATAAKFDTFVAGILVNTVTPEYGTTAGATVSNRGISPAVGDILVINRTAGVVKAQYIRGGTRTDIATLATGSTGALYAGFDASSSARKLVNPVASSAWA